MIMEEEMSTTATTFLPQEIVMDILSRLPAESLVSSFKLVCKAWRYLIQDPDFIKMHLNRRRRRASINGGGGGERRSLIWKPEIGKALFQLHPSPRLNCDEPPFIFEDLPIAVATNLDFDLLPLISRDPSSSGLVGSCNGLLCLSLDEYERIILLNPSTRKYKISPVGLIKSHIQLDFEYVIYGFGCFHNFTTTIDEYMVVRIAYVYQDDEDEDDEDDDDPISNRFEIDISNRFQIDIYSMSSNSWRRVKDIPNLQRFENPTPGVFLNGVVHWIGCKYGNDIWDTIVSFNIRDEVFGEIPMAPCVDDVVVVHDDRGDMILMNWRGGYLGMFHCSHTERMDIDLDIWVMKEYGIGESWTKEFVIRTSDSVPHRELPAGLSISSRHIMTCFWTDDQILIQRKYFLLAHHVGSSSYERRRRVYRRLVLYDMNRKNINKDVLLVDDIPSEPEDEQVDYIDTLVSLKSSLLPLNKQ